MIKPNLIIAGVNKAASTSLFMYLSAHPEICPSKVKETHYYLPLRYRDRELPPFAEYLEQFSHCDGAKYVLEATPGYFYGGRTLAQGIKDTLGDVRIIISFREPISRMFSFFKFRKSMLELDPKLTFDEYIALCENLPFTECVKRENNAFWGIEGGFYSKYLNDWFNVFGRENIQIVFFEHFVEDPKSVLRELCIWLGIEYEKYLHDLDVTIENQTRNYKSRLLQDIALKVNWRWEHFWRTHPELKRNLRSIYYAINGANNQDRISDKSYAHLESIFRPYNRQLARELYEAGYRHLPEWLNKELQESIIPDCVNSVQTDPTGV